MARKKGEKVVNGKVVKAEEVLETVATISEPVVVQEVTVSRGVDLASALKESDEMKVNEQTVIIKIKDGRIDTTMTGYWDGRLLNAAMKSIERKYDEVRRNATIWAMKKSQENNNLTAVN